MKIEFVDVRNDMRLMNYILTKETIGCPIYRFYSLVMYGKELPNLEPLPTIIHFLQECDYGDSNSVEFDKAYALQLLTYQKSFKDFMTLIKDIDNVPEVILITDYNEPSGMVVADSLIKFIQERYGLQTYVIKDLMDIDDNLYSEFSGNGYATFMNDLDLYKMTFENKEQLLSEAYASI